MDPEIQYAKVIARSYVYWPSIGSDIVAHVNGYHNSKALKIVRIKITTIGIIRSLFARLGMPGTLAIDSGTQFTSAEFTQCCLEIGSKTFCGHIRASDKRI